MIHKYFCLKTSRCGLALSVLLEVVIIWLLLVDQVNENRISLVTPNNNRKIKEKDFSSQVTKGKVNWPQQKSWTSVILKRYKKSLLR